MQKSLLKFENFKLKRLFIETTYPQSPGKLLDPIFELFARFEPRNTTRLDENGDAGLRVAPGASFSFGRVECAEPGQRDFVSFFETFGYVVGHGVDCFLRQSFGAFAVFRNARN